MHVKDIAERAVAYNIKGMVVDGNNVAAVDAAMEEAVAHVKAGKGPVLMEMKTYRMAGHYFGDNQNYRTRDEVNSWKDKDPILQCAKLLMEQWEVSEEELNEIRKEEHKAVLDASKAARQMSDPDIEDLTEDLYDPIFADITWKAFQKPDNGGKRL